MISVDDFSWEAEVSVGARVDRSIRRADDAVRLRAVDLPEALLRSLCIDVRGEGCERRGMAVIVCAGGKLMLSPGAWARGAPAPWEPSFQRGEGRPRAVGRSSMASPVHSTRRSSVEEERGRRDGATVVVGVT